MTESYSQSERLLRRKAGFDVFDVGGPAGEDEEGSPPPQREAPEFWLVLQVALDDLIAACKAGSIERAEALLRKNEEELRNKLNINGASATSSETPLVSAVDSGNLELVQLLVDRGADPNKPSKDGMTALHSAAGFNRVDLVKYLLAKGAKQNARDAEGETPKQMASSFGYEQLMAVFDLAETEMGLDALKSEMIAGYAEEQTRRLAADAAKKEMYDLKKRQDEKADAAKRAEKQHNEALRQSREKTAERRISMS